jgi:hypothetical protein
MLFQRSGSTLRRDAGSIELKGTFEEKFRTVDA